MERDSVESPSNPGVKTGREAYSEERASTVTGFPCEPGQVWEEEEVQVRLEPE